MAYVASDLNTKIRSKLASKGFNPKRFTRDSSGIATHVAVYDLPGQSIEDWMQDLHGVLPAFEYVAVIPQGPYLVLYIKV